MYWAMPAIIRESQRLRDSLESALNAATPQRRIAADRRVLVVADEALGRYGFPDGHPFGPDRHGAFLREFRARGLAARCMPGELPRRPRDDELLRFHTPRHVDFVRARSADGQGCSMAATRRPSAAASRRRARVVGATLDAAEALMGGEARARLRAHRGPASRGARRRGRLLHLQRLRRADRDAARERR